MNLANKAVTEYTKGGVLTVNDLSLKVSLGVTPAEQKIPQEVLVSFKLYYPKLPDGCATDMITDTICYDELCQLIKKFVANKSFKLVEAVCLEIFKEMQQFIDNKAKIWLKLVKVAPPVENLRGGVSFEYGDLCE